MSLVVVLATTGGARADSLGGAGVVRVEAEAGEASCPTARALAAAIGHALPTLAVTAEAPRAADEAATRVLVRDRGGRFAVEVAAAGATPPMTREFVDGQRRCDERARAAAVFVALALEPPLVGLPDPPAPTPPPAVPPPPPAVGIAAPPPPAVAAPRRGARARPPAASDDEPPPAPPTSPPAPPRPLRIDLDVAGLVALAPGAAGTLPVTAGGTVRLALGGAHFAVAVGLDATAPALLDEGTARAHVTRLPVDLSARGLYRLGAVEGALDLGLALGPLVVEGTLPGATPQTRLDVALRAALALRLWTFERVAPLLGLAVEYEPLGYALVVSDHGPVGTVPQVWLGVLLGVTARLH